MDKDFVRRKFSHKIKKCTKTVNVLRYLIYKYRDMKKERTIRVIEPKTESCASGHIK